MTLKCNVCVGTTGQGVWHSPDGGETWKRITTPFPIETNCKMLKAHPTKPNKVYAAGSAGVYGSQDGGATWEDLNAPVDGMLVWSVAVDPVDDTIYAGTRPPYLFRSRDDGKSWDKLAVKIPEECEVGLARVSTLEVDPTDHRAVWAGIEVGGIYLSLDGGDTWSQPNDGLRDPDIHNIVFTGEGSRNVTVSTPGEIFFSDNKGQSWQSMVVSTQFPVMRYCRGMAVKSDDPKVVYVATGDTGIGKIGAVQRSKDGGKTWEPLYMPVETNSPLRWMATNPRNPNLIFVASLFGELYRSQDAGDSWEKIKQEFPEVWSVVWTSN